MKKKDIIIGLIIAVSLAGIISRYASSWPDGLERVAENKGFLEKGEGKPIFISPIPDYAWPGIKNEKFATAVAGIVGTIVVFALGYGLAALIRPRNGE